MCLARAYMGRKNDKALLLEEIASLKIKDGKLLLATLFGEEKEIEASIKEIDFMASSVILEEVKP